MFSALALAALWLVVLWRIPTLRQDPWKRAPWIALAALAVALTTDLPTAARVIDHGSGIADLSTLLEHLSGVVASAAVLDWVSALGSPRRQPGFRSHHVAAAVAMAAMTGLFVVMPRPETADFTSTVTGGTAAAYLLVFYAYLGTAMSVAAILFWRVSRHVPPGTLRWGLWLLGAGTTIGACYAAYQALYLALRIPGVISPADAVAVIRAGSDAEDLAILLILAGLSVPAFGVAWQDARDLMALRALRDMWRVLVNAAPEVTAGPWTRGLTGVVRYPHVRLIRRTAEIRDATLALRCYVPADIVAAARTRLADRGLSGPALDAATEACWLRLAIRAVRAGVPAVESAHVLPGGDTLPEEVRWLRTVSAAARSDDATAVTLELADKTAPRAGGFSR